MFNLANLNQLDQLAINNFQQYLRIRSVHPNVDYEPCVKFLQSQAKCLNILFNVYYCAPQKPIVILTWTGTNSSLDSILLNSHMDVVPVFKKNWTYKPFDAHIDDNGNIYGRGAQDMKCVGIQYLEAIRRLKKKGISLKRTIYISFVPDEEVGGILGMKEFVKTRDFQNLKIGFGLDEGVASIDDTFNVFYGERCVWRFRIHFPGQTGHGSLLLDNTAGDKLRYVLDKFSDFRAQEKLKLKTNPNLTLADVTSVNVTMLQGGVHSNVVPDEFTMVLDCRIPFTVDIVKWEETINLWCKEAGEGVWIEYEQKQPQVPSTILNESNKYWMAFKKVFCNMNLKMKLQIYPAGTDSRYLRGIGIPAIGFSPIYNTPVLMHDHNEYLNADVFLRGIAIYTNIISAIAN
ncbi:hypothetical protein FQA39_LY11844 [Lamprigera yunnana]|nr:hypothetical protein FQA39_LY11844 [Lamprigera yunnana]